MRRYMKAIAIANSTFNPTDEQWEELFVAEEACKKEFAELGESSIIKKGRNANDHKANMVA